MGLGFTWIDLAERRLAVASQLPHDGRVLKKITGFVFCFLVFSFLGRTAVAEPEIGFGVRGGLVIDPDGIFAGGHLSLEQVIPKVPDLRFEVAGELGFGFGDFDYFMIRVLGHAKYLFPLSDVPVTPFALGGLQLAYFNFDFGSNTELGLDLGGGVEYQQFGVQLAFGLGDIPDLSLTGYYRF